MSTGSELNFFTERYPNGLGWLRAQFPSGTKLLRVYKSPNYLPHPLAPQRMAAVLPNVRLVLLLREPIERARSAWSMGVERGKEPRSFARAVGDELGPAAACLEHAPALGAPPAICLWAVFYPSFLTSTDPKVCTATVAPTAYRICSITL